MPRTRNGHDGACADTTSNRVQWVCHSTRPPTGMSLTAATDDWPQYQAGHARFSLGRSAGKCRHQVPRHLPETQVASYS